MQFFHWIKHLFTMWKVIYFIKCKTLHIWYHIYIFVMYEKLYYWRKLRHYFFTLSIHLILVTMSIHLFMTHFLLQFMWKHFPINFTNYGVSASEFLENLWRYVFLVLHHRMYLVVSNLKPSTSVLHVSVLHVF